MFTRTTTWILFLLVATGAVLLAGCRLFTIE
jgi:hypothetical protein